MIILGIDPGIGTTGYAVLEEKNSKYILHTYGTIKTKPHTRLADRLSDLDNQLQQVINTYAIDESSVEELFFAKNVKTGIQVAHARGVILLNLNKKKIPVFEYTPLQVKMALTSYGRATKTQVQNMVKRILNISKPITPDDAADAVALAVCHLSSNRILRLKTELL